MIYYRGAHVLKVLQQEGNMSIGKLYARMNETEKMTYPVLMFCLDWLYLINAAELSSCKVRKETPRLTISKVKEGK